MKHFVLSVSMLLSVLYSIGQISFGPSASLNISTMNWGGRGDTYRLTPLPGFQLGAFANYRVNEKLAAHTELIYSYEGVREKHRAVNSSGYLNLNYIRIPLLVQYFITDKLHADGGLNFGIFAGGKEKWNGTSVSLSRNYYKGVDAGLNLGAGYDLSAYVKGLTAGVRFYYGLSNVIKADNLNGGTSFKNRSIAINFRYKLFEDGSWTFQK